MLAPIEQWERAVASVAPATADRRALRAIGRDLLGRLSEPHRRYHTTTHVLGVCAALDELHRAGELTSDQLAIAQLAGWFHDAIYAPAQVEPGANEQASASLVTDTLPAAGVADGDIARVRDLVLATASHALTSDRLTAAFHDADLWILSAPVARYAEYSAQVRQEYAHVPDPAFRAGRAAILRPLLLRESVYATATARARWEPRARANVASEIHRLTSA